MSEPARCARTWEAEAIEDGRLLEGDRASFERHLASCMICAAEVAGLAELKTTMARVGEPSRTQLQRRAQRASLLRRANTAYFSSSNRPSRRWLPLVAAIAVPAAIMLFVLVRRASSHDQSAPTVASPTASDGPRFEVADVKGAVWTSSEEAHVARVTLVSGVASFHVEKVAKTDRFLVELPDGEIEVHGTRFVVDVEAASTRSIDVSEGVVTLRLGGATDRTLRAGSHWAAPTTAASPLPSKAAPASSASTTPAASVAAITKPSKPSFAAAIASSATSKPVIAPPSAGARYGEAVAAYRAGALSNADALLAAFLADFPNDPNGEDAAFLRAAAHERMGDAAGAASLAKAYLARYPDGLRRPEAERIAAGR